ncbi:Flp family type IVb pilin [Nocardioides kribbensis]|uniref:Flp family type IVb pilin n=1 Tax=Nocardioides kribbensis TaxID=305517 RepID=UPI00187A5609|nr:Flp family type IVb pilin [Nocardioides kribbensis]
MITYLSILLNALRTDRDDERGASAVEYGLLIAGIAALIVVVVFAFGDNIQDIFTSTCDSVNGTAAAGCTTD